MAKAEDYARWIVENADKKGTPEFETVAQAYQAAKQSNEGFAASLGRGVLNTAAGAARGAGSIGATLLAPIDIAKDAMAGKGLSLESNRQRRADMDAALSGLGADTQSLAYQGGKLGTEIAGTLGVGGWLANVATRLPGAARAAPVIDAIRTAGFSAGGATGVPGAAVRAAGGAVTGGASAGLVNPADMGSGAVIGAAAPGVLKAAGVAGQKVGQVMRGPEQSPGLAQAVQAARGAGYVIPPTQAKPSLTNRVLEGFSGKITTAQNASAKNAEVTNRLAAEAIGLPPDARLSIEALDKVREEAGKAYQAVAGLGVFDATRANLPKSVKVDESISPLLAGKVKSVDAKELVRAWKQANADATAYYRAYGRDANPETLAKAKAASSEAKKIDEFMVGQIEATAKNAQKALAAEYRAGRITADEFVQKASDLLKQGDLAKQLKDARVRIAKTYSVEAAMNPATGAVDARKLAKQLEKGKVLTGGLKDAADFAGRFPKAAQPVEGMGSLPQTSPLDWGLGAILSAGTANPLGLLGIAARPAARAATLSPMVQNRLIQGQPNALSMMLADPRVQMNLLRATPAGLASDQ